MVNCIILRLGDRESWARVRPVELALAGAVDRGHETWSVAIIVIMCCFICEKMIKISR